MQLAEERIKTVISEGRFQDTLLRNHELSLLSRGFKERPVLEVGAADHYQPANSSLGFSEIDELIE